MPLFLKYRRQDLVELMDMEDCDIQQLNNTYLHFRTINRLLSQWKVIYKKEIRPVLQKLGGSATLLDIGFGGGDVPIHLLEMAKKDGFSLHITAIETDERALEFINTIDTPKEINFQHCASSDLVHQGARFDLVISNHLVHHLDGETFNAVLSDARSMATYKVLFNDIERSDLGYALYAVFSRLLFRNSFVVYDGSLSIRRSFTLAELKEQKPSNWKVRRIFPFRLLLTYSPNGNG